MFHYIAPPTICKFAESDAFGRLIAGPVGSGKTTGIIAELLRRSIEQTPGDDGVRHTRFSVIRQTLKQLKDTVLKDCEMWLTLNKIGYWRVSESTYHVKFDNIDSEWTFLPMEDDADRGRLLSTNMTGLWMSECIEMDISILGHVVGRIGRFPNGHLGAPTWQGIVADTNFPAEMTEWQEWMENPRPGWQIFKQPSGLSPEAENLDFLNQTEETLRLPLGHPERIARGREYYNRIVRQFGSDSDYVKRYVMAMYGDDPSGKAVFHQTFRMNWHGVPDTMVIPGYPLIIGQDFGRDPWSVICQPDHLGRLIVHEEVSAENIGLEKHIQEHLKPRLAQSKYLGCRVAIVGDPAGVAKSTISEETSFNCIQRLGLPAVPAPTNELDARIRSVEAFLGRHSNGGPAMLINTQGCPHLMRALGGGYRFEIMQQSGLRKAVPRKDKYSHVADALQYVCLVANGGMVPAIAQSLQPSIRAPQRPVSAGGWT